MTAAMSVLVAVKDLVPFIQARAQDAEAARRMPPDVFERLKDAGCFRMFVPRSHGGEELDLLTGLEVLETLARADGGAGWTVMLGCETPHLIALMPPDVFNRVYASTPDVVLGGGFAPQGEARVMDGGYRVSGRWNFATGSQHCDWLFGTCVLLKDGAPVPGATPGVPATRGMVFRASEARVIENWSVLGLRGTGSHDIAVEDLFVPDAYSIDIFAGQPTRGGHLYAAPLLQFALHMGAVAVGIAQGALDDLVAHATTGKKRLYASTSLADSTLFQHKLGHAETTLRAVRSALHVEARELWDTAMAAPEAAPARMLRVLSTLTWAAETCSQVVDTAFKAVGGNAVRDSAPVQRRFRDIHTFAQHGAAADGWYAQHGATLLGRAPLPGK